MASYDLWSEQNIMWLKHEVVGMERTLVIFQDIAGRYLQKKDGQVMKRYNLANNIKKRVIREIERLETNLRSKGYIDRIEIKNLKSQIIKFKSLTKEAA